MPSQASEPVLSDAIVRLEDAETGRFFCTGIVVSHNRIVTAAHCVGETLFGIAMPRVTLITVRNSDGVKIAQATVEAFRSDRDLAVLHGDFYFLPKMAMDTSPAGIEASKEHRIMACGYPYGGVLHCVKIKDFRQWVFWMRGQGGLFPGMSGGAVIDLDTGKLIGVNSGMQEEDAILAPLIGIEALLNIRF